MGRLAKALRCPRTPTGVHMRGLTDHGLPLVQLKEQRRDLVVALQNHAGPVTPWQLMQIAAVQQAISASEDVIVDLDAECQVENDDNLILQPKCA